MIDKQRLRTFLLGGAVGALTGILLAPRSGQEVRSNIVNRAGEARERSRETYFETQERLQERISEAFDNPGKPERETGVTLGTPTQPEAQKTFTGRPKLRDVSEERSGERPEDESPGTRSEDLRQKVQETRERLRSRLNDPRYDPRSRHEEEDEPRNE